METPGTSKLNRHGNGARIVLPKNGQNISHTRAGVQVGEIRSFGMEDMLYLLLIIEIVLMSTVADKVRDVRRLKGEA